MLNVLHIYKISPAYINVIFFWKLWHTFHPIITGHYDRFNELIFRSKIYDSGNLPSLQILQSKLAIWTNYYVSKKKENRKLPGAADFVLRYDPRFVSDSESKTHSESSVMLAWT